MRIRSVFDVSIAILPAAVLSTAMLVASEDCLSNLNLKSQSTLSVKRKITVSVLVVLGIVTCKLASGELVPIPTNPADVMRMRSARLPEEAVLNSIAPSVVPLSRTVAMRDISVELLKLLICPVAFPAPAVRLPCKLKYEIVPLIVNSGFPPPTKAGLVVPIPKLSALASQKNFGVVPVSS